MFGLGCGALIGTLSGELLGMLLPVGVVKDFFLTSINFDLAGLAGQDSGVIVLNLIIFTVKFGLSLKFNFTSLIGLATAYYLLRFFR
jgi:hypothetical protein|tara:strand:+ start:16740 stop:17000 length:261 start_codon:yes stop_codon:yes gene_type:complete